MHAFLHQSQFYTVLRCTASQTHIDAAVRFNADHPVFAGHFADRPIVPGVCLYQLIREIGMLGWQTPLRMLRGGSLKFLQLVSPGPDELTVHIRANCLTTSTISINSTISNAAGTIVCKATIMFTTS